MQLKKDKDEEEDFLHYFNSEFDVQESLFKSKSRLNASYGQQIAEGKTLQLADIFSNDIGRKIMLKNDMYGNNEYQALTDINDSDKALMRIKIQFLYDILIKNAWSKYPNSLPIMFFKAYVS